MRRRRNWEVLYLVETRTNKLGGLPYLEVWVVTIAMPFICRFFAANWAPEIVCCGMLGHGKFVVGKLSPEYLFGSILGPSRPGNTGEKSGRAILYWHFHVFKPKYVSQERSFHAAVVVGENIIIVGDTDRHICKFWTYIGQIKKGGKDRRQTSKWFGEVPTDTDSTSSTNTGEIVKSEYVLKISIFWTILGGKQFNLTNDGSFICATNYQGGFVVIGGTMMGKVDRWWVQTIWKLISYLL